MTDAMTVSQYRIISMVPSWTEMLLCLGLNVVGRTRFCIEPANLVKPVTIVGGTKDWDLELIQSLKPDLIILDKEENPKFMSEGHAIPFVATHVCDLPSCAEGIRLILDALSPQAPESILQALENMARRWDVLIAQNKNTLRLESTSHTWSQLPGVIDWIQKPDGPIDCVYYIIWKNPWMVASNDTFIGNMWSHLGISLSPATVSSDNKYPEVILERFNKDNTLLLFSSEPFPFEKKKSEIQNLGFAAAIVDGQSFSWFGIRSLLFLESHLLKS